VLVFTEHNEWRRHNPLTRAATWRLRASTTSTWPCPRAWRLPCRPACNLRTEKACPDLLRAARQVIDTELPVRFVAVGQGPLEAELDSLHAELDLGEGFRFLGYREDARRLLAGSDLFPLSSS
jgi:hypothetical protein